MMKVGFDAKRYFNNQTGLGNYSRWLIDGITTSQQVTPLLFTKKVTYDKHQIQSPSGFWKKVPSLWRVFKLSDEIRKSNLKVFHGLSNELPYGIHRLDSIKKIVTIHDLIFKRYPNTYPIIDRLIYNKKVNYAQKVADVIIVPSIQTKNDLHQYYGTSRDKIKVVPLSLLARKTALETTKNTNQPYIL